jgi:CRISPR/Cas system-associated exonuclease Cas4 (RecB family)
MEAARIASENHPLKTIHRDYLSYSAISLFVNCPLRYYFKYVAGLRERTVSASLVFGSAMHRAIQYHFEQLMAGCSAPDLDTLLAIYQDGWRARDLRDVRFDNGTTIDSLGRLADHLLQTFQRSDFAHPEGHILAIEEEFRDKLIPGAPDLLARVDLVVDTGDTLVVSDFKTARSKWSWGQVQESAIQLLLYSELVKQLADGKPLRLEFAVLTKTKVPALTIHPVEIDSHRVERMKRLFERVWRAIQAGHFYPNPSHLSCPSCPFREPCQDWKG